MEEMEEEREVGRDREGKGIGTREEAERKRVKR